MLHVFFLLNIFTELNLFLYPLKVRFKMNRFFLLISLCTSWYLYQMVAQNMVHTYRVYQIFRFVESIWLYRKSRQIRLSIKKAFILEDPIFQLIASKQTKHLLFHLHMTFYCALARRALRHWTLGTSLVDPDPHFLALVTVSGFY